MITSTTGKMGSPEMALSHPRRYSWKGLWTLFLVTALPIHLWTIILVLNDFSWITERTNAWDAVGVGAYGMIYAFIESVVISVVLVLLGFLLPKKWSEAKRISLLSVLYLITAGWAILGQVYFLINFHLPDPIFWYLVRSGHPLRIMYPFLLALAGISALIPAIWIVRTEKATQIVGGILDRLSILSMFYLIFDVVALVIILIRNL